MSQEPPDLLPLGSTFDVVRRGYDPAQVEEYLDRIDADLRILAADRDAAIAQAADLGRQLSSAQAHIHALRMELEQLAKPPDTLEGLSVRLQRMLRLTREETTEMRDRARADAENIRAAAEANADQLRASATDEAARLRAQLAAEQEHAKHQREQAMAALDQRRQDMEAEHRAVIAQAERDAERIRQATRDDCARLAAEDAERRAEVEIDFKIAMDERRAEALRELAEHKKRGLDEARERVRVATEDARRITTAAEQRVRELQQLRERIADQLETVRSLLAEVPAQLRELPEEATLTPPRGAPRPRPTPAAAATDDPPAAG